VPEEHRCADCRLSYAAVDPSGVPERISSLLTALTVALDAVPAEDAGRRPDPDTWSVAEYVCHIRDVLVTYTLRLHRARVEDRPALDPMYNDLRARRFRYAEADPRAVVTELPRLTAGLADEVARVGRGDWDRRVTRLPGEERTARWLARSALHEVTHHLTDVRRVAARVAADRGRRTSP
jgi:hypothetical protein